MATKRPRPTPEQWAEWEEAHDRLLARLERAKAMEQERREREERRRARLRRLTFGLLGR